MDTPRPVAAALACALLCACTPHRHRPGVDADASTLTADVASAVADGTSRITISVSARTAGGKTLRGRTVTLAVTGASNSIAQPGTTDVDGTAQGTLASTTAETKQVSATLEPDGVTLTQVLTLDFLADASAISASLSSASATPATDVVADGATLADVDVVVRDVHGNVVSDQVVSLAASGTDNTLVQPAGTTSAAGTASGALASTRAEAKAVTVTVNPGPDAVVLDDAPTVAFIGDAATISALTSSVEVLPASEVVANGLAFALVSVIVRDVNGNAVPGQLVELAVSGSGNVLTQPSAATNAAGVANGLVQSVTAELKTLTATVNPGPDAVVLATEPTVSFVGDAANLSASLSTFSVSPAAGTAADGIAEVTATVTARDANGNAVEGVTAELLATGAANVFVQPADTDADGVASGTLVTTAAERKTLRARLDPAGAAVDVLQTGDTAFVWNRGASYYVRTSGSDGNAGTSPVTAWRTLTHALAALASGDTLYVGAGTYAEAPLLAASGTGNDPIRILADTSGARCGDPGAVVIDAGGGAAAIDLGDASWVELEGFTLIGATAGADAAGVRVRGSHVTLRENDLYGNQLGVLAEGDTAWWGAQPFRRRLRFGVAHDELPAGYTIDVTLDTRTATTGVALASGDDVRVVRQSAGGGFTELERLGDLFDDAATTLSFRLPSTLPANADENPGGSYWVYYGDAAAGAPPADPALVYWFDESFDRPDGTLLGGDWIEWNDAGDMRLSGGALVIDPSGDADPPQVGARQDFPLGAIPCDFTLTWAWTMPVNAEGIWSFWGMNIGTAASTSTANRTAGVGVGLYNAESLGLSGTEIITADMATNLETSINGAHAFRLDVDVSAFAYDYWRDDVLRAAAVPFVNPQVVLDEIRFGADNFGADPGEQQTIDDVRIVLVVADPPETSADAEEARPAANGDELVLEHNRISGCFGTGVVLRNSVASVVRDNLVYGNGGSGVSIEDGSTGVVVELNTLYMNADDQVLVAGAWTDASVQDNAIVGGGADGIGVTAGAAATSSANVVWGNGGAGWSGLAPGAGDQTADPLFVDPSGPDGLLGGAQGADDSFHLDAGAPSPALDAGSRSATTMGFSAGGSAAERTSRADGVLDGTSPDASTANVGYHYPARLDALDALDAAGARVLVAEGTVRQPAARAFSADTATWASADRLPAGGGTLRWLVQAASPLANDETLVLVGADDGAASVLDTLLFDGTAWEAGPRVTGAGDVDARGFDGVFERVSGEALVVWSDGTATPSWRTRTDGSWSAAQALPLNDGAGPDPDTNGGSVRWVELVTRAGTDEAQLLFADTAGALVALAWDGDGWNTASAATLETDLKTNALSGGVDNRAFDAAFEAQSGDLVAAWARAGVNGFFAAVRAAGADAFGGPVAVLAPAASTPHFLDLAAESGTDRIAACALGLGDGVERLGVATWDGGTWVDATEADAQIRDADDAQPGDFPGAVAWHAGTALCVYADDDVGALGWATWTAAGGWTLAADEPVAGLDSVESVQARVTVGGDVLVVVSDAAGDVWALAFDGGWTITAGGAPIASTVPTSAAAPLALDTLAD